MHESSQLIHYYLQFFRQNEENQPLIPRRNPPVRVNHHIPYHGNFRDAIRDPIFWLFFSFAIAVILSLFLLIGAILSWSPTVEKLESEGRFLFCIYYIFHCTAWNTQSVKFLFFLQQLCINHSPIPNYFQVIGKIQISYLEQFLGRIALILTIHGFSS